jgi:hypothetical protein
MSCKGNAAHNTMALPSPVAAEEELENGEHAGASKNQHGCTHEQLGREEPGAGMHIIEENLVQADLRMSEPCKHE